MIFSWRFLAGLFVGALAVFLWDRRSTVKALYENRQVIDKGSSAVEHAQQLYGDVKDIITSVRTANN